VLSRTAETMCGIGSEQVATYCNQTVSRLRTQASQGLYSAGTSRGGEGKSGRRKVQVGRPHKLHSTRRFKYHQGGTLCAMLCARAQLPRRDLLYFSDNEGLVLLREPWPDRFSMLGLLYEYAQRTVVGVYHCCTLFRMSASNFHLTSVCLPCITLTQRM
jgi:hypothetical protein